MIRTFTQKDFDRCHGEHIYGRVIDYSRSTGYGFIRTEFGSDIFVSSFDLTSGLEKKMHFGTTVTLIPVQRNNKYVATSVSIVSGPSDKDAVVLPSGQRVSQRYIKKICIVPGSSVVKKLRAEHGHEAILKMKSDGIVHRDLDCVKIVTLGGDEYTVFGPKSPIEGDGRVPDIDKYFDSLIGEFQVL